MVVPCKGSGVFAVGESMVVVIILFIVPSEDVVRVTGPVLIENAGVSVVSAEGLMIVRLVVEVAFSVGVNVSVEMVVTGFSVVRPEVIAEATIPVGKDNVVISDSVVAILSASVGRTTLVVFCPVVRVAFSMGVSVSVEMAVIGFSVVISPEVIDDVTVLVDKDFVVTSDSVVAVLSASVGRTPLVVVCSKRGVAVNVVTCVDLEL